MGLWDVLEKKEIELNKRYAKTENWTPADFGATRFDDDLIMKVKAFQARYSLQQDGIVGPSTYRRLMTEKEAIHTTANKFIVCNGKPIEIEWHKVKLWTDSDGFAAPEGSYKKSTRTNIQMFVVHFDVCLSSKSCFSVLKQRNLSVPFLIDNDGTIYQTLDTQHIAWHAAGVNEKSVGVEISNAFYTKYQPTYEKLGFGPRPVISDSVVHKHKVETHLGFYPIQNEALKALIKALNKGLGIPLQTPAINGVVPEVVSGKYSGVIHHYHVTANKIDSAGCDLVKLIEEIKQ